MSRTPELISPDAMGAAAAHVEREYGYGYALGVEYGSRLGQSVFLVCHFDGSEFRLIADRYGNVDRLPDEWKGLTVAQQLNTLDELKAARDARLAAIHSVRDCPQPGECCTLD